MATHPLDITKQKKDKWEKNRSYFIKYKYKINTEAINNCTNKHNTDV